MPNSTQAVKRLHDALSESGNVRLRPMFGEYAIYCNEKVVALFCDDILYLKTTPPGRDALGDAIEQPPYPGAKPHLVVSNEQLDDRAWLKELIQSTARALPARLPRSKKK